jgi:hypothetical protein
MGESGNKLYSQMLCFEEYISVFTMFLILVGHTMAQWLRRCATKQKVMGLIPDGIIGIFP